MKKLNSLAFFIILFSLLGAEATAQYSEVTDPDSLPSVDFTPNGRRQSSELNALIEMQSRRRSRNGRGGRIRIRRGTYSFSNIQMKSNVHLRFDRGVTINPPSNEAFNCSGGIRNFTFVGPANFEILGTRARRAFVFRDATNFLVENFSVEKNFTRFSAIFMAANEVRGNAGPSNGTIRRLTVTESDGGFGGIQMHAAQSMNFNNIESTGGVTLRFESGIENDFRIGNITGRDIRSINGRSAALFQPHALDHGRVRLNDVSSDGSAFAVELRNGFVDENSRENGFNSAGSFTNVILRNVRATFGARNAMIRPISIPSIPRELSSTVRSFNSGDTILGPSISAVFSTAEYPVRFRGGDPRLIGFEHQSVPLIDDTAVISDREISRIENLFDTNPQIATPSSN